jgi:flagellin
MPSYINTNLASLNAQRNLNTSQTAQQTALQRLSSGLRINSAKDDAAGMAIASRMSSQIAGSTQAARNANDGISLAQTAEGDLTQISANLQRMRDLSVQSANATNSTSDRAALNQEVQALSQEIDRVAQNSSFNGVKLLDGTFTAQNFQVGAGSTVNDSIAISAISSARTSQLGGASLTSNAVSIGGVVTGALVAGALTINGQQIGASVAGAAPGESSDSSIQVAAAINLSSALTGVSAVANANSVTGAAATAFTGIAANTFNINGINIGAVTAGTTATGQGSNIAAAINLVSNQTGVTATADTVTGALTLTAADGRDVLIGMNGAATAAGATTNRTALQAQTGIALANIGTQGTGVAVAVTAGTSTAVVTTAAVLMTAAAAAGTVAGIMTAGSLIINTTAGAISVGQIVLGTNATTNGASIAAAINSALAAATGGAAVNGTATSALGVITLTTGTIAGSFFSLSQGGVAGDATQATANQVTLTGQTGFAAGPLGTQAISGLGNAVDNRGTITLSSTNANGIVLSGGSPALAGFTAGTTAPAGSTFTSIAGLNISTVAGATSALSAIDGAIATVNASRANLGAYQNRFASVVTSLQTTTENLTASRSRIQDTDFAAETSALSRAQILQQAGTAMLAQANQLPNQVMTLLR